ncbi:hypothetical protein EGR_08417 [Echinococcus granulosus]|uniref:Ig-like domain-containing protein n=1 Tax=Echinococcus granulosus TaxID=6210 RepID=W6UTE8_ECHGR|nr:hypothetical protein EGR_08417 [Echinococcus granulosus]EUB56689.1 hypothetical protein EGR_08417 [Echinococcus granulosus]
MYFGLVPQFLPLLLCTSLVHCDLVIKPPLLIAEAYHDAFFLCQIDSNILSVIWTLPSSEVVLANKTSTDNRFRNSGGFLFISNVSFADSGDYECSIDENTSSVGVLEVFVMPSYTLDLSLVCGLNVILLILFIFFNVLSHIRYKTTGSQYFVFQLGTGSVSLIKKITVLPPLNNEGFMQPERLGYRTPDPAVEEEAFRENEEALSRASQNSTTRVNHISANAAAGLIILNNRSLPTSLCKPPNSAQASSEITSDKTGTSNPCPVSTPNISRQQSSLFSVRLQIVFVVNIDSSTTENDCVFLDPFAEFVAARPAIAASQTANQSSLSAQLAYNTSTTSPLQNIQSVQPSSSSPVYKLQTFPPPPSASTVFSASSPPVSSSLFSQRLSTNNPFAVMNESATVAMQSNTTLAPKAANIPTSLGQNSFNPFVDEQGQFAKVMFYLLAILQTEKEKIMNAP